MNFEKLCDFGFLKILSRQRFFLKVVCLTLLCAFVSKPIAAKDEILRELWKQGERAIRQGEFEQSEVIWQNIVQGSPTNNKARLKLSYVLLKQRKLVPAFDQAEIVRMADPKNARAWSLSGMTVLMAGNFKRALSDFYQANSLDGSDAMAWAGLGLIDFYEHRTEEGALKLDRATFLDPSEPDYFFDLAQVQSRAENYKEAAVAYENFLRLAPKKDADRRARIIGLIQFLKYIGSKLSLYSIDGKNETTVPIEVVNNRPILRVKIGKHNQEFKFVLDTGSGICVISDELATTLKIKSIARGGNARAVGGGGKFEIVYGFLDSASIGDVRIKNIPVYIRKFSSDPQRIDGFIGLSMISKFLTTLDYGNKTFSLSKQKKSDSVGDASNSLTGEPFSLPLRVTSSGFLSGEVELQGIEVPLNFIVDTGATITVLSNQLAAHQQMNKFIQPTKMRVVGAAGVAEDASSFILPSIKVARQQRESLSAVALNLDPINETTGFEQSGILGGNFLKDFRLVFDFRRSIVTFMPSNAGADSMKKREKEIIEPFNE